MFAVYKIGGFKYFWSVSRWGVQILLECSKLSISNILESSNLEDSNIFGVFQAGEFKYFLQEEVMEVCMGGWLLRAECKS